MTYGRIDDALYLHGAIANAMLRASDGADVCVTVTLLDALVLARGDAPLDELPLRGALRTRRAGRRRGGEAPRLDAVVEHSVAGRSVVARAANAAELRATLVLRLPIVEGSVKVRAGGPVDDPADLGLPVWAGIVPVHLARGEPVADGGTVTR